MKYPEKLTAMISDRMNEDEAHIVEKLVSDVSSRVHEIPVKLLADEPGLNFILRYMSRSDGEAPC